MVRFDFRLKGLLSLREHERDVQHAALAELLAAERRLAQQRRDVAQQLAASQLAQRASTARGRLDLNRLQTASAFDAMLRAELAALDEQAVSLADVVAQQQLALVEAERQVRLLEKLRERHWQQWLRAQAGAERRALDEAGARLPRQSA